MNTITSGNELNAKRNIFVPLAAALLMIALLPWQGASARGFAARGANGGGAGFHRANLAGPNGGSLQSSGNTTYKTGVGAQSQGSFNGTTANGASGYGSHNGQYNAQTGQGTSNAAAQFTSASGQNYGGSESSTYTKGQGGTTAINTDNHGSYDVDWARGQKPVVTPVGTSQ
ncbi:MAG: hypothetical protein KGS72_27335 [Cyanobacteria bacterium REEB67]|nr:hypothetical protein [Cyanobacteria bacterium REEB67]